MRKLTWRWLVALATTLGGFAAVGSFFHDVWPSRAPPDAPIAGTQVGGDTVAAPRQVGAAPEAVSSGEKETSSDTGSHPAGGSETNPSPPTGPLELSLADGERKVVLGGHAALAARFAYVGPRLLPTLEIDDEGPDHRPHALLGVGSGRFELRAAGKTYTVTVLRVDATARRIDLRIDPR